MDIGKYDMLVQVAKLYDELELLRDENDRLSARLQSYKMAAASGKMTPEMLNVYEYGLSALFDDCTFSWVGIKVSANPEVPDEPVVETSFEDWLSESKARKSYPSWMSDDTFDMLFADEAHKRYDEKVEQAVENFKIARGERC